MQNGLCQCCVPLVLLACMSQDRADQYRAEQSSPAGILSHVLSSIQRISSFPIFERGVTVRIHEGGRRHLRPLTLERRDARGKVEVRVQARIAAGWVDFEQWELLLLLRDVRFTLDDGEMQGWLEDKIVRLPLLPSTK